MRRKIAAGNWKMNTTLEEAKSLSNIVAAGSRPDDVEVILGVPSLFASSIMPGIQNYSNMSIAIQNCHQNEKGAFTGELSAAMIASMNIPYVILGHSERREYFKESDALILEKCKMALSHGVTPIYCCGEPLDIRESETQNDYVKSQFEKSILQLTAEDFSQIIIAYEPIWAIGTGKTASPDQAQEMHAYLRKLISEQFGEEQANKTPILYGGSVKPGNANDLFGKADVDGGLVGGASLKASDFLEIINAF